MQKKISLVPLPAALSFALETKLLYNITRNSHKLVRNWWSGIKILKNYKNNGAS